jgi:hypothetical protein
MGVPTGKEEKKVCKKGGQGASWETERGNKTEEGKLSQSKLLAEFQPNKKDQRQRSLIQLSHP